MFPNYDFFTFLASDMLRRSREASGKSQEAVAKALEVSKKTVQNWEAGVAVPNFYYSIKWFDAIGVPFYPYLMELLYPREVASISKDSDTEEIRSALHKYVDELDDLHVRELMYLFYGSHGSSPTGTLDVVTAYLHLPLAVRICTTEAVLQDYKAVQAMDLIAEEDHVLPAVETLEKYLENAKNAVLKGKNSYL